MEKLSPGYARLCVLFLQGYLLQNEMPPSVSMGQLNDSAAATADKYKMTVENPVYGFDITEKKFVEQSAVNDLYSQADLPSDAPAEPLYDQAA